jgi:succinate dehydrogenase / fumarate reductase flavoprotein subunit
MRGLEGRPARDAGRCNVPFDDAASLRAKLDVPSASVQETGLLSAVPACRCPPCAAKSGKSRVMNELDCDVLVIGAGGAGMYAALSAARAGARVLLVDRGLIGRAGATVMAQMTVAVALGEECPDTPEAHLNDTLAAGRGLCDPALARLLVEDGPARIREMDAWKVGWARAEDGSHIRQAHAPGHDRPRCVYVDFLNTGPAVSRTLRTQLNPVSAVRRIGDIVITDIATHAGRATGAVGFELGSGAAVSLRAGATIIATGGLTRLYARNSASANMGGDGYALALRAGAELLDMEFVQFFPIGHLAPRLIGMDPIMWDPFRYKLGGRLLNRDGDEFSERYGREASGRYNLTRDVATYAIFKEVEAGRGSPAGGAFLSFTHVPEAELRRNFGPVIDRLAKNGIDLTRQAVEVAPIAHYHMGGVAVGPDMATRVPGLYACGEAVGGANGANRLSGNAITEALVFGEVAGRHAAAHARAQGALRVAGDAPSLSLVTGAATLCRPEGAGSRSGLASLMTRLQALMAEKVGPFRTHDKLAAALAELAAMQAELGEAPPPAAGGYDMARLDWYDLRNMLLVARCVAEAAIARKESRGAHQREDLPGMLPEWEANQVIEWRDDGLRLKRRAALQQREAA